MSSFLSKLERPFKDAAKFLRRRNPDSLSKRPSNTKSHKPSVIRASLDVISQRNHSPDFPLHQTAAATSVTEKNAPATGGDRIFEQLNSATREAPREQSLSPDGDSAPLAANPVIPSQVGKPRVRLCNRMNSACIIEITRDASGEVCVILRSAEDPIPPPSRSTAPRWRRRHIPLPDIPELSPPTADDSPSPPALDIAFSGIHAPQRSPLSPFLELEELSSEDFKGNEGDVGEMGDAESTDDSSDSHQLAFWAS
ncbi:hypothetical protein PUNSTDRAFT_134691 [Punctularia strigosozonata HHB-11173 SS5]|uniref:uncharacterized protein n=1 Tax=Punctularia strigosozonata (strain HHB-11173) TaxID=741275 RepID=UPI0004416693|nr:uncharacterized protein PUNSTDRAFT_134691 [Punctularia strigosozonata HHB-11173 SS5]EIN08299.1 hypothetical protein PUNSTDRAFT_134691 [Punctularia strigosozonata HHB-11173 SS5]